MQYTIEGIKITNEIDKNMDVYEEYDEYECLNSDRILFYCVIVYECILTGINIFMMVYLYY